MYSHAVDTACSGIGSDIFFWNHISYAFSEGPYGIAWSIQKHFQKKI